MARKIFYITDYWRVLKICARIHIEAYGLGGGFVVYGSDNDDDDDYGSHLFHFTSEAKKKKFHCFKWLVYEWWIIWAVLSGDAALCWKSHDIRAIQHSIQLWSVYEIFGGNKKIVKECSWGRKKKPANDYTPFGYTEIVWCIRVLLWWMNKIC